MKIISPQLHMNLWWVYVDQPVTHWHTDPSHWKAHVWTKSTLIITWPAAALANSEMTLSPGNHFSSGKNCRRPWILRHPHRIHGFLHFFFKNTFGRETTAPLLKEDGLRIANPFPLIHGACTLHVMPSAVQCLDGYLVHKSMVIMMAKTKHSAEKKHGCFSCRTGQSEDMAQAVLYVRMWRV